MQFLIAQRCIPALFLSLSVPGAAGEGGQALPIDRAREAALLQVTGTGFSIKRTPHFIVACDTEGSLTSALTNRIEQTYHMVYRFCEMNGIAARRHDHRLEVLFFDKRAPYDRYAASHRFPSAGTYGVYFESTNRSAFFNVANDQQLIQFNADLAAAHANIDDLVRTMDSIRSDQAHVEIQFADGRRIAGTKAQVARQLAKEIESGREELETLDRRRKAYIDHINRMVIQHETAHQVFFNAGVHVRGASNPKWLVEGLACLFETPPGPAGTGFTVVNQLRLRDFRSAVAGGSKKRRLTWQDYGQATVAGRLPSPQRLIAEPRLFDGPAEDSVASYATAWALTHFLQRTRRAQLAGYLRAVSSRQPDCDLTPAQELALFEAHFGPIDQTFLKRFSGYILWLKCHGPEGGF